MNQEIITEVAKSLQIKPKQVNVVLTLLGEKNTVPFIARYRKDQTGNLDEDQIREIEKIYQYAVNLQNRKEEVIRLIKEKNLLTKELEVEINQAEKLQTIEDIYLPFKEKRKTKATEAIKAGFEPLANLMLKYPRKEGTIEKEAQKYLTEEFPTIKEVIEQAGFIIAEIIAEKPKHRDYVRRSIKRFGKVTTSFKKSADKHEEVYKYEMYQDFSQIIGKMPSYRILAVNRGEKQKILNVKIEADHVHIQNNLLNFETRRFENDSNKYMEEIVADSYKRLIFPAIERELRKELTENAQTQAIELFSDNLEKLILESPVKDKIILGVDPAFRTGCKMAVINEESNPLEIAVMYPHKPQNKVDQAESIVSKLLKKYQFDQIVIGNGTASRETEKFIKNWSQKANYQGAISIVSEAGASVYSASKVAQNEFPDLQVEERSAISIARRVQDPMAELVKIEPKAIGVGQYQHDVNQKELSESLDFVMLKAINKVGVDVNTASQELLKYISGLDKTTARNIVNYRAENGKFKNRKELLKVPRLGPKAYEQAAGFLKVMDGIEKLDQTFIHPESYKLAKAIIKVSDNENNNYGTKEFSDNLETHLTEINKLSDDIHTLKDIMLALKQPNLDIREKANAAQFDSTITSINDVKIGMKVPGQIRNIVEFGAFVDIGIKNDGLVHISQLSNSFIKDVREIVNIGDIKTFKVIAVDEKKNQVQLSLKED